MTIPPAVFDAMVAHARRDLPAEACGYLVGRDEVEDYLPLRNALASPVAYEVEPRELFRVQRELDASGLKVLAVVHSHPTVPAVPSAADLARNGHGDTVPHVIVSLMDGDAEVRGWRLGEGTFEEETVEIG